MKSKSVFVCKQCGNETPRWQVVEESMRARKEKIASKSRAGASASRRACSLADLLRSRRRALCDAFMPAPGIEPAVSVACNLSARRCPRRERVRNTFLRGAGGRLQGGSLRAHVSFSSIFLLSALMLTRSNGCRESHGKTASELLALLLFGLPLL